MLKEIKEDLNKWKGILCSCIGRIDIVNMLILPKVAYGFNVIPIKIPTTHFAEMKRSILKFIWNFKRLQITKTVLEKNKFRGLTTSQFQNLLQSYSNQYSGIGIRIDI